MANRITAGQGLFGAINVNTTATVADANFTTLNVGGAGITQRRSKSIAVSGVGLGSTEKSAGWSLPTKGAVNEVWLEITAGTTAAGTMNIGILSTTSGDADGFIAAIPTSSASHATTGIVGGTLTYTSSGAVVAYYGALLCPAVATNTTANIAMTRVRPWVFDAATSAKTISYTMSTTANGSFAGNIIIDYTVFA